MNEEQRSTDERIAAAAGDLYHVPPETPRDEMWAAIEVRLDDAVDGDATESRPGGVLRALPIGAGYAEGRDARGRSIRRLAWWAGVAAALVIGLGIGRLSMHTEPAEVRVATEPAAESAAETDVARGPESGSEDTGVGMADGGEPTETLADAADPIDDTGRAAGPDRAAPGAARNAAPPAGDGAPLPGGSLRDGMGRPGLQYAVATRRLLDRGESFLVAVQADLASPAPDPLMEAWARSLLSRTRVLMASPGGREPETRRLLEDLELMLAQIVMTTATRDPGEAQILGEGLEGGDLLYRLRSATEEDSGPDAFRTSRTSSL